jgi:seryl-tRNA synthetase
LLSRLGADAAAPVLDVSLNEFVAAGVADTIELLNGRVGEADREREKAEAELKEFSERAQRCDAAEAELSQARQEIEETSQKCRELEANLEYLESRYSNRIDAAPAEPKPKKPRRTRVEDEEGVYFRETPDGRVFEIGYADSERKQRWKTVGPDLDEAVALRKELAGKPHQTREAVTT